MAVAVIWIFPAGRLVRASALPGHGRVVNISDFSAWNWTFDSSIQAFPGRISHCENYKTGL